MKINSDTKISKIIDYNSDSIETIATINKHFKKLKNPILRKMLATRVSVSDAAKMGGVTVDFFLKKLESIGFDITEDKPVFKDNINVDMDNFSNKEIIELDARPELDKGIDPFKSIMKAIKNLPTGKTLKIINTFEPIPLIKILSEKGFDFKVERNDEGLVYTYFTHIDEKPDNKDLPTDLVEDNSEIFDKVKSRFNKKLKEVDVRGLEMPLPMVTILQEIEDLPSDHCLFVHHKRIPQFLLKELEERGYNLVGKKIDEANTKLLIYKK